MPSRFAAALPPIECANRTASVLNYSVYCRFGTDPFLPISPSVHQKTTKVLMHVKLRQDQTLRTVGKWRQRFIDQRLDGLLDAPRPGQPRKISDAKVEEVLAMTLERKPREATHWSTRLMAKATGLNQTAIVRI
jgi:hypothetical protein